jgi:serine/threonine protein kinase
MDKEFLQAIPGYQLLGPLGEGGMAEVYVAVQECFGRKVALKILPSSNDGDEFRHRFLQEAKIVAQLTHSHIIAVHDVGEITGSYYIAMDFLPGKNLKDLIRDGLKPKAAIHIIKQVAEALDFAHKKGFIHRDVKPDNVLFREDGSAVLTDFGIASDVRNNLSLTQTGLVYGTPNYMSPEQAFGQPTDSRSDLYSLGVMFYQMLTHRLPYRTSDPIDMAMMHQNDPLPLLPFELNILQPVIDKLLAKSPDERYQRASEFKEDLTELSAWDIEELDGFDAAEHYAYEDYQAFDEDEETQGFAKLHAVAEGLNYETKAVNPFSQRDFSGLFIKFIFLLTVSFVLVLIFSPELLEAMPYYEKYKTLLDTLISGTAG